MLLFILGIIVGLILCPVLFFVILNCMPSCEDCFSSIDFEEMDDPDHVETKGKSDE